MQKSFKKLLDGKNKIDYNAYQIHRDKDADNGACKRDPLSASFFVTVQP